MTRSKTSVADADLGDLVKSIVQDFGNLLGLQLDVLRGDLGRELQRAGGAALEMATGGGLLAAGGLLSGLALAHVLHRATRLPLWCCYGAAAGACGAGGAALVRAGGKKLGNFQLLPRETIAAAKENLSWLKEQVKPGAQ